MALNKKIIVFIILSLSVYCHATINEQQVINPYGQVGFNRLYSAKTLGTAHLIFNIYSDFSYDKNFIKSILEPSFINSNDTIYPDAAVGSAKLSTAFGITNFLDAALMLPIYYDIINSYTPQGGLGDLDFTLKLGIPQIKEHNICRGALIYGMTFPTGSSDNGYFPRHSYYFDKNSLRSDSVIVVSGDSSAAPFSFYSSRKPEVLFDALFSLDLNYFLMHLNSGINIPFNGNLDKALLMNIGIELHPSAWFAFSSELGSETRMYNVEHGFKIFNDPIWISPGVTFTSPGDMNFSITGTFPLSSNKYEFYYDPKNRKLFTAGIQPKWRVAMQLGWSISFISQDSDKDGILDKNDGCPDKAEDIDGFEDSDGCPDFDNDKDGIPDSLDKCTNAVEDFDGFEDDDGCPDWDNDQDGVVDSVDKCSDLKEDFDGYKDSDGCPDLDNDNDRVPDSLDKCIALPEDKDGFQDNDGCPDIDNDMDGIPDSLDKCPDEAGPKENQGCSQKIFKAKEIKSGRVILKGVDFESGQTVLLESSYAILDQVYESLTQWSDIKLEIRGFTDNLNTSEENVNLSQKRADAVRDYLVGKGIGADRLITKGYGNSEPVSVKSVIQNNRIEIIRRD